MSRKRKRTLVKLAEEKTRARQEPVPTTDNLDDSLQLPGPSALSILTESGDRESNGEEYWGKFTSDDARVCYDDWLVTLPRENVQMMAMMLYDSYIKRFGLQTKAAEEVALLRGVNEKTIRQLRYDWIDNNGSFSARYIAIDDEEYHDKALKWIRENASAKGKPNMTAATFCAWLESDLLPLYRQHHPDAPVKVSIPTTTHWLHKLGFNPPSTKKGLYIDRHERKDIVDYRKLYRKMPDFKYEKTKVTYAAVDIE